jgi:hypothetical protein
MWQEREYIIEMVGNMKEMKIILVIE